MLSAIGSSVRNKFSSLLYGTGFFLQVMKSIPDFFRKRRISYKVLTMQILFTGFEALGVIALISVALGAVIIIQGISMLSQFLSDNVVYTILIAVITRELGPILTAFIIIARSGTAIATEIGGMVVDHQIEAYVANGINPLSYIVVPRFIGVTVSLLLLNVYFNIFGLIGSFAVIKLFTGMEIQSYFQNLLSILQPVDIFSALLKSLAFGMVISIVSTYYGFKVEQSSTEIPVAAIKAVGQSFIFCIVVDIIITLIYYL
ncbi:MAG: ABC transporter permease [Spirochaetales bacterium]|nr:ABC transporter permease [Spirochaetales bacterium]